MGRAMIAASLLEQVGLSVSLPPLNKLRYRGTNAFEWRDTEKKIQKEGALNALSVLPPFPPGGHSFPDGRKEAYDLHLSPLILDPNAN